MAHCESIRVARSEASDDETLVSLGAKEGELECRTNRTVGKFIEALQNEFNLKVKVYTNDNWVAVLDGITLETVKKIPNSSTKALMEQYLGYKREDNDTAMGTVVVKTADVSDEYKGIQLIDIPFRKVEIPSNEEDYEDYAKKILGDTYYVVGVVYHSYPNGDNYAYVDSAMDDAERVLSNAKRFIDDNIDKNEKITIYLSYRVETYPFVLDMTGGIVGVTGVALNEFCDGGNKHYYSYEWDNDEFGDKVIFRVQWGIGGETNIFMAHSNGSIELLDLSDEQFNKLLVLSTIQNADKKYEECDRIPLFYEGKMGFVDKNGNIVIQPQFEREEDSPTWQNGIMKVKLNGRYGYINADGNFVIEPKFEGITYFGENGLAGAKANNKWGFIDIKGNFVIEPKFDDVRKFQEDLAGVKIDD